MADRRDFSEPAKSLFRMVVDRIPGLIWSTDADLRITSALGTGWSVLDLRPGEAVGTSLYDFFQTTDPDFPAIAAHRRALSGETADFEEVRLGRTLRVRLQPLRDEADRIVGCTGFAQDVTEAQQVHLALVARLDRAQKYLDIADVMLLVLDRIGRISMLNRKGYEVLGYERDSLFGKDWFETCAPANERPAIRTVFEQLMAGRLVSAEYFENSVLTRTGEERIIAWHNTLLTDETGMRIGTLSSGEDITERRHAEKALQEAHDELERRVAERTAELAKANEQLRHEVRERRRVEEALRQSHKELQAIYDGMTDGLLVADVETKRFLRANDTICRMLGYSEAELLKLHVADVHPEEDLPRVLEKFGSLAQQNLPMAENVPIRRKDGSVFYADITSSSIVYQGRCCLIGFFRDITERRRVQEALRREREALKNLLASSDRERQLIAYEIHDGLAQQIAGAKMQFEMFGRLAGQGTADARHAQAETARLLNESMAEARRLIGGLRPPVLDEEGVVAAVEHYVRDAENYLGIRIEFYSDVGFSRLEPALENTLLRIVQEGVTNAGKYSQSDRVRVELRQEGSTVRLVVQDWGVGFDPAAATAGFGLEGIRQRARLHGGDALVESAPGQGARIAVNLPIVERKGSPDG